MSSFVHLEIPHIDNTTNAVTLFHNLKAIIDFRKCLSVSDELINL
jgi:hypothetical protein